MYRGGLVRMMLYLIWLYWAFHKICKICFYRWWQNNRGWILISKSFKQIVYDNAHLNNFDEKLLHNKQRKLFIQNAGVKCYVFFQGRRQKMIFRWILNIDDGRNVPDLNRTPHDHPKRCTQHDAWNRECKKDAKNALTAKQFLGTI